MAKNYDAYLSVLKEFRNKLFNEKTGLYEKYVDSINDHLMCVDESTFRTIVYESVKISSVLKPEDIKKQINENLSGINYRAVDYYYEKVGKAWSGNSSGNPIIAQRLNDIVFGPTQRVIASAKQINDTIYNHLYDEKGLLDSFTELIEKIMNKVLSYKKGDVVEQYRLVGDSEEFLTWLHDAKDNFTYEAIERHRRAMLDNSYATIDGFKEEVEEYYLSIEKEIYDVVIPFLNSNLISTMLVLTSKIYLSDLLPDDLKTSDAAYKIASYFANRRADTPKEAFNLYFKEKRDDEEEDEAREAAKESRKKVKSIIPTPAELDRQLKVRAELTTDYMKFQNMVNNEVRKIEKENDKIDKLIDEHNKLVEKHNALVDKLSK